jgi:hypothetical protein
MKMRQRRRQLMKGPVCPLRWMLLNKFLREMGAMLVAQDQDQSDRSKQ